MFKIAPQQFMRFSGWDCRFVDCRVSHPRPTNLHASRAGLELQHCNGNFTFLIFSTTLDMASYLGHEQLN